MKYVLIKLTLGLLFTTSTFAYNSNDHFKPMAICGDRALVIDSKEITRTVDRSGRVERNTYYQSVLTNPEVIRYFLSTGAISPEELNSYGEFIVELSKDQFSNSQYHGMRKGKVIELTINNYNSINLKVNSPIFDGSNEMANFTFNDCRLLN